MSAVPVTQYTLAEYLAREETAVGKSEFYRGNIFAMAGGTSQHSKIGGNIFGRLFSRLGGMPCQPCNSDQQIRIPKNGLLTYPDVSVVCGEFQFDPLAPHAINNPSVIFEVLSKSTEHYDRTEKFELYRDLESLREYVLVAQGKPHIERYERRDDHSWLMTIFDGLEAVMELPTLNCTLSLAEIYAGVTFQADEATQRLTLSE